MMEGKEELMKERPTARKQERKELETINVNKKSGKKSKKKERNQREGKVKEQATK